MKCSIADNDSLRDINHIYNHYVENSTATFDTEIRSLEFHTKWFENVGRDRVWIIEDEGAIQGYLALQRWSPRKAYDRTAEITIYILPDQKRKGLGHTLFQHGLNQCGSLGIKTIIAKICTESIDSINFHKKNGFESIGVMKGVGYKFGRLLDVELFQITLQN